MNRAALLDRLEAVEARLDDLANAGRTAALTEPDAATGERWEEGEVWAHIAEFLPYWADEARRVLDRPGDRFGRTKIDPRRLAGIAEHRGDAIDRLLAGIHDGIDDARRLLAETPESAWEARGVHPVRGRVPVSLVVEEFIVKHLEEHADQLASLR